MKENKSHFTSALIPLSSACSDCLNRPGADNLELHRDGAISKDGTFAWLHMGSYLEIFSTQAGQRIAAWCFGAVLKEPSTVVTCCCELTIGTCNRLLVGTESSSTFLLLMFDIKSARVSKAIQIPEQVTSIDVVSSVVADQSAEHILSGHLQHFSGVVAVGTRGGHIYLIDLNVDDEEEKSDEIKPASLRFLNPRVRDIASERYNAMATGEHLCIELGEDASRRGSFYYKKPDDQTIKYFPVDEVSVSNMKFIAPTGQLAVGFSFGCFQLWRLSIPVLEYSSRYEDDLSPVTHFAFQEPENDPRNFCYLWVARGPQPFEQDVDYNSVVSLYQLGYTRKLWYDGFGYHFEELTSVGPRFDHELTTDPYNLTQNSPGSRLVACYTLEDPKYRATDRDAEHDSFEEGSGGPDLSLCVMVWEAGYTSQEPSCHVALFDMNRWYHAQMPYQIRAFAGHQEACSFFAFYSLKDVLKACNPAGLLGVHVPFSSLSKFNSVAIPAPEQHFCPSSLSFDTCFLTENGLVQSKYLGIQRQFLAELQDFGAESIVEPTAMYSACLYAGLLPRRTDSSSLQVHKREAVLSAALDYGLMSFLNHCISQFGSGELISRGLNLRFLVDWAWKRVAHVKDSVDKLCVSLYDWSGVPLDQQTLQLFHQHFTTLHRLTAIFTSLLAQPSTDIGKQDLETKLNVCTLIKQHVQVVLWFYSVGLLPEHSEEDSNGLMQYSYPGKVLRDSYRSRRSDVQTLHSELKTSDVLHIDGLVEHVGQPLKVLLEKEGAVGEYPFPNFHCLLTMYLVEGVPVHVKHALVLYTLCDLYALVPEQIQQDFNDKMQQFTQAFALSTSVQKFVQAIWLLDHKDFEDALVYLLDPCVDSDIAPWQHTVTIKSLLYQAQHKLALKYIRVKKPALLTPEDVKLRLTVLLANGLTSEAFEYQRLSRDQLNGDDLLSHLFIGSQQTKTVDQLIQLPFTEEEEAHLVAYLRTSKHVQAHELLVMYYLQRSRFIEAIRLNTKIRQSFMGDMDVTSRERAVTRNSIVDGYQRVLPHVQRKLAFGPEEAVQRRTKTRSEFKRPTPLSMTVNKRDADRAITRATLLRAVIDKTREVRQEELAQEQQPATSSEDEIDKPGPFICTPLTPRPSRTPAQPSEVVFPSTSTLHYIQMTDRMTPIALSPAMYGGMSPLKGRYLTSSPAKSQLSVLSDTFNKAKRRLTNAADLTLLQTPPVKRKTPRRKLATPDIATPGTTHSILKARTKPLRRSPSPLIFSQASRIDSDLVLPTPPVFRTRFTSFAEKCEKALPVSPLVSQASSSSDTVKHLRFSMPQNEDSNSRASEESGQVLEEGQGESSDVSGSEISEDRSNREPTPPSPGDGWQSTPEIEELPSLQQPIAVRKEYIQKSASIRTQIAMVDNDGSPNSSTSEHSPLQRRSIKDRSPNTDRISPMSTSVAKRNQVQVDTDITFNFTKPINVSVPLSPATSRILKEDTVRVDKDVTFNFTKPIDVVNFDMEDGDTEPLVPQTISNSHISQQRSHSESSHDSEEIVCVDDDIAQQNTHQDMETDNKISAVQNEDLTEVTIDENESDVSRRKFVSFGSSFQAEVGMTKIDETSVILKKSPPKVPAQEFVSVTDSNESPQSGSENVQLFTERQDSENIDIESALERSDNIGLENREAHESISAGSEDNLRLVLEGEYVDDWDYEYPPQPTEIRSEPTLASDTYQVVTTEQRVYETTENSRDSPSVPPAQNTNLNNTAFDRVQLSGVSVVISPPSIERAEHSLMRQSQSQTKSSFTISKQLDPSSLTFVSNMSQSDSSVQYQSDISQSQSTTRSHSTRSLINASTLTTESVSESMEGAGVVHSATECTKEQADSSDDQTIHPDTAQADTVPQPPRTPSKTVAPSTKHTPTRTPTRLATTKQAPVTPSRKSGRIQGVPAPEENCDVLTPRRSTRRHTADVEELAPPTKGTNFKTPPHPTRILLPPTPPESSAASTTSSAEPSESTSPARSRVKQRLGAPKRGKRTKARSRSSSPPVVSSTTADVPAENGMDLQTRQDTEMAVEDKMATGESGTLSVNAESAKHRSRETQQMEFTFSDPRKVHDFDGNVTPTSTALSASFVFSPPLTRAKTRRLSLTRAPSPSASVIGLLPVDITTTEQDAAPSIPAASPPKKARGKAKRDVKIVSAASDSPINFIPEPDPAEMEQIKNKRKTRMTLRTRTQPPPLLQRTRVRSLKK